MTVARPNPNHLNNLIHFIQLTFCHSSSMSLRAVPDVTATATAQIRITRMLLFVTPKYNIKACFFILDKIEYTKKDFCILQQN
jgi:hypothetical protein